MSNAHLPESDEYPMFVFNVLSHLPKISASNYPQQIHFLGSLNGLCLRMNNDQMLQFSSFSMGQRGVWSILISYILNYKQSPEQSIMAARLATILILNPRVANDFAVTFASSLEVFTEILIPKKSASVVTQKIVGTLYSYKQSRSDSASRDSSASAEPSSIPDDSQRKRPNSSQRTLPVGVTVIPDVVLENFQLEKDKDGSAAKATPDSSISQIPMQKNTLPPPGSSPNTSVPSLEQRNKLARIQEKIMKHISFTNILLADAVSSFLSLLSRQSPSVRKILQTEACMINLIKALEETNFLEIFVPSRLINITNILLNVITSAHDVATFRLDLLGRKYDLQRKMITLGSNIVFCGNLNWQKIFLEGAELNINNTGMANEAGKVIYSNQDLYMLKLLYNILLGYLMDLSINS